jgi:hypothetical protein
MIMHKKLLMVLPLLRVCVHNLFFLLCFTQILSAPFSKHVTFIATPIDQGAQLITGTFTLAKKDFIYKDFISFSTDNPAITLSEWKADLPATHYYDPLFKSTKQIFNKNFTITLTATAVAELTEPAHLFCSYYQKSENKIKQYIFPLTFAGERQKISASPSHLQAKNETITSAPITAAKTKHVLKSPFDDWIALIAPFTAYCTHLWPIPHHVHSCFIAFLWLLLLILTLLLYKKKIPHGFWAHTIGISCFSCCFILGGYLLHYVSHQFTHSFVSTLPSFYLLFIGIFYLKKSSNCLLGLLQPLISCIGVLLVILAIFFAFIAIQSIY